MQVFEFHFNPKQKEGLIFDSYSYEPENIYEKRLGNLYMVGILKKALPKNFHLLEKLFKTVKQRYYKTTIFTPEKSLKESLKESNELLEDIAKKGDVSWLGNLSFAVLNFKNFKMNFTKVGGMRIFLIRAGKIIDIDSKLKLEEIEPYPLRVFGNIVSGKLAEGDIVLVFTKEVLDFFQTEGLLEKIAKLPYFSSQELKIIFDEKKEKLLEIVGACVAIILKKEQTLGKRETISPIPTKEFSLKEVFSPLLSIFKKRKRISPPPKLVKKSKVSKSFKLPKLPISLPTEIFEIDFAYLFLNNSRKIFLVVAFLLILFLGSLFLK